MEIESYSTELIEFGAVNKAQDLYLLPKNQHYQLYFRKGEYYWRKETLSFEEGRQLIARYKYLGGMDVSEKRKAQLGAISYPLNKSTQRLRLSSVGNYRQQESLVIRFVHQFGTSSENYLLKEQLQVIQENTQLPGLYLFCGPVGSGKTTLMYRLAKELSGQVITIEDPVEIIEENFLQLQVNLKIEQTYDELIKLSLRHHPDVLIIGEIRDPATAFGALRASLTGHRVFATLHTSQLEHVKNRMLDLGCNQLLLEESLKGIVYQRLLSQEKKEPALLAAYQFFENQVSQNWQESCTEAKKRGIAYDYFDEK